MELLRQNRILGGCNSSKVRSRPSPAASISQKTCFHSSKTHIFPNRTFLRKQRSGTTLACSSGTFSHPWTLEWRSGRPTEASCRTIEKCVPPGHREVSQMASRRGHIWKLFEGLRPYILPDGLRKALLIDLGPIYIKKRVFPFYVQSIFPEGVLISSNLPACRKLFSETHQARLWRFAFHYSGFSILQATLSCRMDLTCFLPTGGSLSNPAIPFLLPGQPQTVFNPASIALPLGYVYIDGNAPKVLLLKRH